METHAKPTQRERVFENVFFDRMFKNIRTRLSVPLTFQEFSRQQILVIIKACSFWKGQQIDGQNVPTGDDRKPSKYASGHVWRNYRNVLFGRRALSKVNQKHAGH